MSPKEQCEQWLELFTLYPKGTHFCMTSKQPGYEYNKWNLAPLLSLLCKAMDVIDLSRDVDGILHGRFQELWETWESDQKDLGET